MTEHDAFEARVETGLRAFADRAATSVDPIGLAWRAAGSERPAPLATLRWRPALVWLLLVGALVAGAAAALVVGGTLLRSPWLVVRPEPTTVPAPSSAPAIVAPTAAPTPEAASVGTAGQIAALAWAPDGTIWAATRRGVLHWDLEAGTATAYGQADGLPTTGAQRIAVAADGTAWAGGYGWLARFDGSWTAFTEFAGLPVSDPGPFAVAPDGILWTAADAYAADGTAMPQLLRFDGEWTAIPIDVAGEATSSWRRVEIAPDRTIWASTYQGGIFAFDGVRWTGHTAASTGLPDAPVLAGVAPDGAVWAEMPAFCDSPTGPCPDPGHGVARFDGTRWIQYTVADGLADSDVQLALGPEGSVWATYDLAPGQISRFDGTRWTTFAVDELAGWSGAGVAPDGSLWLASAEGLARFDGETVTYPAIPDTAAPAGLPPLVAVPRDEPAVTPSTLGEISWQAFDVPTSHFLWPVVETPYGFAARDGPDLRWSADGRSWDGVTLSIDASGLSAAGEDLVAYGSGAVRLAWDGGRWVEAERLEIAIDPDEYIGQVVVGPRGAVLSIGSTLLFSTDGTRFREAVRGPDASLVTGRVATCVSSWGSEGPLPQIGPILATADGFVALTPADRSDWTKEPWCEPVAWFSPDGRDWELDSPMSPFGAGAWVTDIAGRDGRFVAVGGSATGGAVWLSEDGRAWRREALEVGGVIRVAAGDLGWVLLESGGHGWVSDDGLTWEPLPDGAPRVRWAWGPPALAVGARAIVVSTPNVDPKLVVGTVSP